jgi:phage/plasmid-like protein (TIGR03299 family)
MPANISVRDGKASFMGVREPAWHGLGTVLNRPATAAEALSAANLDWQVVKQPLFAGEDEKRPISDYFAVVREDAKKRDTTVLGIVGSDYTPLQNRDAFQFFDPLVGENAAVYHTAGALGKGERVWIQAKLPGYIRVVGDDITNKFLLLSNIHGGRGAVEIKFTPIRVVCQNTLTMALWQGPALRIAHTWDVRERLLIAANRITMRFDEIASVFGEMAKVQMNKERMSEYLRAVFPDPPQGWSFAHNLPELLQARRDREAAEYLAETGRGTEIKGVKGTLWAAYNGVAEYIDYFRFDQAEPERRLREIWFGDGYLAKARAYWIAEQKLKIWVDRSVNSRDCVYSLA